MVGRVSAINQVQTNVGTVQHTHHLINTPEAKIAQFRR